MSTRWLAALAVLVACGSRRDEPPDHEIAERIQREYLAELNRKAQLQVPPLPPSPAPPGSDPQPQAAQPPKPAAPPPSEGQQLRLDVIDARTRATRTLRVPTC